MIPSLRYIAAISIVSVPLLLYVFQNSQSSLLSSLPTKWIVEKLKLQKLTLDDSTTERAENGHYDNSSPIILDWTRYFQPITIYCSKSRDPCTYCGCTFTKNRSEATRASALVFYGFNKINWGALPPNRKESQYYVYFNRESPQRSHRIPRSRNDFFNLTMTFRQDSHVVWPSGTFVPNETGWTSEKLLKIAKNKSKLMAWFASNCQTPSTRERFVRKLQGYLPVDIFGHCGPLKCKRWSEQCENMLKTDYKFYLALENSVCKDYITEKFFRLTRFVVPIVFKRSFYEHFAPTKSFIALDDFASFPELVAHLKYLDTNVTAYLEYFEWHKHFFAVPTSGVINSSQALEQYGYGLCGLCKAVRQLKGTKRAVNITEWWNVGGECKNHFGDKLYQRKI